MNRRSYRVVCVPLREPTSATHVFRTTVAPFWATNEAALPPLSLARKGKGYRFEEPLSKYL